MNMHAPKLYDTIKKTQGDIVNCIKTTDRSGVYRFYTTEDISPHKSLTPEGYLLCESVPIARTGTQLYAQSETPIEAINGIITIDRREEDVFTPETLASFEGKSVTINHPDEFLNPSNWKALTSGITQNIRRGKDIEKDLLLADLLITDQQAIDLVSRVKNIQVSCGYDTEYVQDAPGFGHQTNIIGNHVALVSRGRAGQRCSIRDGALKMAKKRSVWDRVWTAFKAQDEEAMKEAVEEAKEEAEDLDSSNKNAEGEDYPREARDAMIKILDRLKVIDEKIEAIEKKKDEVEDLLITPESSGKMEIGKTYNTGDTLSRIEILAPGAKVKSTDSLTNPDSLISIQRSTLKQSKEKEVESLLRGRTIDSLSIEQVSEIFYASSELVASRNNSNLIQGKKSTTDNVRPLSRVEQINKANAEHWGKK